jgi:hypothetical protein
MTTSLWQNQSFLRLWLAQVVSNAGSKITGVALPLTAVLVLGATPTQMGLLGIANSLPNQLSLRQVVTSVHLLGRVTAARRFVLFGVAVLGAALGGLLGETIGLRATLFFSVAALVGELLLILFSSVRHAHV